jgi:hypothetical protein
LAISEENRRRLVSVGTCEAVKSALIKYGENNKDVAENVSYSFIYLLYHSVDVALWCIVNMYRGTSSTVQYHSVIHTRNRQKR